MRVTLASDTIDQDDLAALAEWLGQGNRLTKGPETSAFESEFAARVGARHAVFVNSGSSANLLMVAALKESGRIRRPVAVVPAVSWVTTVTPFLQLGFEVHLCDADPGNLGLDLVHLERLFTSHRPSVLALVQVLGHPNHMKEILDLCDRFDVVLIEDSCEALGSVDEGGRSLGTIGELGSFSLYFGHHLSTIEGGVVVTDDDDLYEALVALRSHGWARDLPQERQAELASAHGVDEFHNLYTFYYAGYNLRSTDLQAFIGRRQLRRLPEVVDVRQRTFAAYRDALPDFYHQSSSASVLSAFAYGTLVTEPAMVASALREAGVECRPLICGNIGRHPFWTQRFGPAGLPVADQVHTYGLYLPIHASMTEADALYAAEALEAAAEPYALE